MWKRLTAAALALALALALTLPGSASVLNVNGQNLWERSLAYLDNGTTYVSLRVVSNVLAPRAEVSWSQGTAWVKGEGVTLKAVPGESYITVNDRALYVPKGVRLENGRVMVPIRVLAEALGGTVRHYRDKTGLEADAVVVLADGRWAPIEVKMGQSRVDEAAKHLIKLAERVDVDREGSPSFLMVVTATETAYVRKDGVIVAPLATLAP